MLFSMLFLLKEIYQISRESTLQATYRKPATGNLVQHGFSSPKDMPLSHDSNQISLPGGCNELPKLPTYLHLAPRPSIRPYRIHAIDFFFLFLYTYHENWTIALTTLYVPFVNGNNIQRL